MRICARSLMLRARAEPSFGGPVDNLVHKTACSRERESSTSMQHRTGQLWVSIGTASNTACSLGDWVPGAAQSAGAIAALAAQRGADPGYESPYSREALRQGLDLAWWQKLAGASVRDGRLELGALRVRPKGFSSRVSGPGPGLLAEAGWRISTQWPPGAGRPTGAPPGVFEGFQALHLAWWQKVGGASVRDGCLELGALRVIPGGYLCVFRPWTWPGGRSWPACRCAMVAWSWAPCGCAPGLSEGVSRPWTWPGGRSWPAHQYAMAAWSWAPCGCAPGVSERGFRLWTWPSGRGWLARLCGTAAWSWAPCGLGFVSGDSGPGPGLMAGAGRRVRARRPPGSWAPCRCAPGFFRTPSGARCASVGRPYLWEKLAIAWCKAAPFQGRSIALGVVDRPHLYSHSQTIYPDRVGWVQGGKVDDVTVLVALVVEEQPPAEPTPAQPAPELERAAAALAEPAEAAETAAA